MNSAWLAEFYHGGFLTPLNTIDPAFKLDPQVMSYDDTGYWDAARKSNNAKTGVVYGVPINGNIQVLYYRADLYEKAGLKVPQTWEELAANAKALNSPPNVYGMVQRGARSASDISYDWMPYLHSHNGAIFKDEKAGDFTVTINSPEARQALDVYVNLAKTVGPPNPGSYGQAQVIQALLTGKAAHATPVIAAWPQLDDATKSAVVGKVNVAVLPHGPGAGPRRRWVTSSAESRTTSPRTGKWPHWRSCAGSSPTTPRSNTRRPGNRRSAATSTQRRS